MCIYVWPEKGLYLYASTEEILLHALRNMPLSIEGSEKLSLSCGEILCITQDGTSAKTEFSTDQLLSRWYYPNRPFHLSSNYNSPWTPRTQRDEHLRELKSVARYFDFRPETIDSLLEDGFTTDDIEEMFYCGSFY